VSRNLFTVGTAAARDGWKTHLLRGHDSEPYYDWLVHVGSLTGRLRQCCDDFRVALLRQELARPGRDEWAGLHLAHRDLAWVREVVLYCADTPMVFAHSVLPRRGVRGAWHLVAGLGTRPLGAILFADPLIRRMPFAIAGSTRATRCIIRRSAPPTTMAVRRRANCGRAVPNSAAAAGRSWSPRSSCPIS